MHCVVERTLRLSGKYFFNNFTGTFMKRDFSFEFFEIFKSTCFVKHLHMTVSVYNLANFKLNKSLVVSNYLSIWFNYVRNTKTNKILLTHEITTKFLDFYLISMANPAGFWYQYTGISTQVLILKKSRSTIFYTDIFLTTTTEYTPLNRWSNGKITMYI